MNNLIKKRIKDHQKVCKKIIKNDDIIKKVNKICNIIIENFSKKKSYPLLFVGNGGSAADSQHLAAEFSGRFMFDRSPLNAEALHCNTSYVTAVSNDYSYEEIFSRLLEAKAKNGGILFCLSTSGKSKNIVKALKKSKKLGVYSISIIGNHKKTPMEKNSDLTIRIPSKETARIQEGQMILGHIICEIVEKEIFNKN